MARRKKTLVLSKTFRTMMHNNWPKHDEHEAWNASHPELAFSTHPYVNAKKGEPVDAVVADRLVAFLDACGKGKYRVDEIAAELPDHDESKWWTGSWDGIKRRIAERYQIASESYCDPHRESEYMLAAKLVLRHVGHELNETGLPLSEHLAQQHGEMKMDRRLRDYGLWHRNLLLADRLATLFTVVEGKDDGQPNERWGVWTMVPLKQAPYQACRCGRLEDSQFTQDDFQSPSKWLYLHAMTRPVEISGKNFDRVSEVQVRTMMYMLAMLLPPILSVSGGLSVPNLLSIAPIPENEARLNAFGFRNTGHRAPRSGQALYEMAPPRGFQPTLEGLYKAGQYGAMCVTVLWHQLMLWEERKLRRRD